MCSVRERSGQSGLAGGARGSLGPVIDASQVERVLVITAHPDDVDFGAAGTVAVLTDRGVAVTYCIVTDGDAGGFDEDVPRATMASIRRDEQTRAAKEVGVSHLIFLGEPDGRLQPDLDLRLRLSRVIRQVCPDLVITQHPVRNLARIHASHPDHLAVGEAALCAVFPDCPEPLRLPGAVGRGLAGRGWCPRCG